MSSPERAAAFAAVKLLECEIHVETELSVLTKEPKASVPASAVHVSREVSSLSTEVYSSNGLKIAIV